KSAETITNLLDSMTPTFAPLAARWDTEADRRAKLRTPENLKALMDAQRAHNSARSTAASARSQRSAARKASKNPLSAARRAARTADKAARSHRDDAKSKLKTARKNYPTTLKARAIQAHAVHTVPGAGISALAWDQAGPWPVAGSLALIAANVAALAIGRRQPRIEVEDGLSVEERQLVERLDPAYWVQHAADRGLSGTVTTPATVGTAGIECDVRLDGEWNVGKLRKAADAVRALLGARTELPMMIGPGSRGGWGVIRLRTRSAAPGGIIVWQPGEPLGIDMTTGEEVDVPLGHRVLVAGMSGSGKSTASRPLLYGASEGPTNVLVIIDLKKVEGRLWDHRARVAHTPVEVVDLVAELVEELNERLDVLPKGQATLVPTADRPRITVVVDEGAEVMAHCQKVETVTGYTDKGKPIVEKLNALEGLDTIARMGRAACIDLWWMTQSPTYGDGVPRQIAKQLGLRIGLAVESPTEARVVFGESAQEKGWKADELPMPGVAMVRDGKRKPEPVKVRYMDDDAVVRLPNQPIWHREESPARSAGASAPAPLRLVKDTPDYVIAPPVTEPAAAIPAQPTNRDKVRAAVATGAKTAADVALVTGINKGSVSKALKSLVDAGEVLRSEDGSLSVPTQAGEVSA
ncbi:FtsK/SpoIIIE domain-containing protein, partial [Streptomyces anthocyanicus]|uniref:FtsK/SpoIIIE domain-containing protein n=2 Tax=Streptomyces TaxID=1883 RepID=UPI00340AFC5C